MTSQEVHNQIIFSVGWQAFLLTPWDRSTKTVQNWNPCSWSHPMPAGSKSLLVEFFFLKNMTSETPVTGILAAPKPSASSQARAWGRRWDHSPQDNKCRKEEERLQATALFFLPSSLLIPFSPTITICFLWLDHTHQYLPHSVGSLSAKRTCILSFPTAQFIKICSGEHNLDKLTHN